MGREHRLSRDARLRQESDWGDARIPAPVSVTFGDVRFGPDQVIAGIDVGESFLDVALLKRGWRSLEVARVDLRGLESGAAHESIAELARRIAAVAPAMRGAVVLVDSPRWPRDLDWSASTATSRFPACRGRMIDVKLREMVARLLADGPVRALRPLSLFPTPMLSYFDAHLAAPACKPHLHALGLAMFADVLSAQPPPPAGGTFTRFMVAGFAVYRALAHLEAAAYESFPDLQFRLWSPSSTLPSKTRRKGISKAALLASRVAVLESLTGAMGADGCSALRSMDAADAAIMAMSVAEASRDGVVALIDSREEGRFLAAFDSDCGQRLIRAFQGANPHKNDIVS